MNSHVLTRKQLWILVGLHAIESIGFFGAMVLFWLADWKIVAGIIFMYVGWLGYCARKGFQE